MSGERAVVICDRRRYERDALELLCRSSSGVFVHGIASDWDALMDRLRDAPAGVVVLVGYTVLRDSPGVVVAIREQGPVGTRVLGVGMESEGEALALIGRHALDGWIARDGEAADAVALMVADNAGSGAAPG